MMTDSAVPHGPKPQRPTLATLKPFSRWLLRYRGRIALALLALVVASAATLTIPMAVRRVIDHGFGASNEGVINTYFLGLIGVIVVLAVASSLRYYLVTTLGERVVADIRADLFSRLVGFDVAFYDGARSGELISRLSADTTQLKSAFGVSASVALRNFFLFAGATMMMVISSPKLSGLVLLAMPIIVLPLVGAGRSVRRKSKAAQDRLADATAYATEQIGAIRTIKAFGAESRIRSGYGAANEFAFDSARATLRQRAIITGVAIFLIFASIIGVMWFGATDVSEGRMSAGELSQFLLYAVFAAGGLSQLSEVWTELSAAAGAAERMAELIDTKALIADQAEAPAKLSDAVRFDTVRFDAVAFAYPGQPNETVLGPINFAVKPGERLAIVGPSGGGKSTIIQLLMRFYDPSTGRIIAGETPYTELEPSVLRANLALVPQDPVIFAASIRDNIRYAKLEASDAEIEHAAEMAAARDFITELPQGFDTPVGERGVTLSGGQRQRIAIARAILKDAPILLLDEATSALDAESEAAVQRALDALLKGRTSIVIAHRLATIKNADRILVVEDGRIVEEGTHASLIRANGLYARLAALQFNPANDQGAPAPRIEAAE
jgi:ATP-binding cassette, subfamily B, bacterial